MPDRGIQAIVTAKRLAVVTDLDGTLIPLAPRPELAVPSGAVIALLRDLAALPGVTVTVASGRPRETMAAWFGDAPEIALYAEHGAWRRDEAGWHANVDGDPEPVQRLAAELERLVARAPGAFVERKTWGLALHHRLAGPAVKVELLVAAAAVIDTFVARYPALERMEGKELIEVRLAGATKARAVSGARERSGEGASVLALGDDVTDEEMFRALSVQDAAVVVGSDLDPPGEGRFRCPSVEMAHALLAWVRDLRRGATTSGPPAGFQDRTRPSGAQFDLIVVSNRLPELRSVVEVGESRKRHVGGLVSALTPALSSRHGVWLGWSGRTLGADAALDHGLDLDARPVLAWIDFPASWQERYYNGMCNAALWPLLHSFPGHVRIDHRDYEAYRQANIALARSAQRLAAPGAAVWIHDYHLLLLGSELRALGHQGPMGLFFHVPFCSPDLFFMLPWADELMRAMLALDLIGFHTAGYAENFMRCAAALADVQIEDRVIRHAGGRTRVGVFPIGIIPDEFQPRSEPAVSEEIAGLMRALAGRRLVLGVDRLDYTKGIPERLMAFGRMLTNIPEWRRQVSLVQVSVPSRADVREYAEQRALIERIVGNVNGELGDADWVPIRYLYRSYGIDVLAELYRAADVGYVTPLRDGMNLVAKEYVAAQDPARPGVLLLSRFAGAAAELDAALLTNPYDVEGMARDLDRALRMGEHERLERHTRLLAAVRRTTAMSWAEDFLGQLTGV